MAKKQAALLTGIGGLLGEVPTSTPQENKPQPAPKQATVKSSNKNTRATFVISEEALKKLKAVAYWDRKQQKDVLEEALTQYFERYEKRNGNIDTNY